MNELKDRTKWPVVKYDTSDEPHFLFVITPPFSGSTALAELLNSSYKTMMLQQRAEGQWLIPGMCETGRWRPGKRINYRSVKSVWLEKYQSINSLVQNVEVVIEKSPPNMMRMEELSSHFEKCSFIANNKNPYANCASILYRSSDADNLDPEKRISILKSLARDWIMRSKKIRELTNTLDAPLITYEAFCNDPSSVIEQLKLPAGVADSMNTNVMVKVKDYEPQPISNQNERQISKLNELEVKVLTNILRKHPDLLSYFNYELYP